jgi:hypothetical protein
MRMQAYCYLCEKTVEVHPWSITDDDFWEAIKTDAAIEIGHTTALDDVHRWKLKTHERRALRKNEHILRRTQG